MDTKNLCLLPISIEELENTIRKVISDSININHISNNLNSETDFLTRRETAKLLKITLPTLYEWTKRGYLKSYRMATRIRYKQSEVVDAINSRQLNNCGRAV